MAPQLKAKYALKTEWIHQFARTYFPSEGGLSFAPEKLREVGLNLVALRNVLRTGRVIYFDACDEPGEVWVIDGRDNDGERFLLTLRVVTETQEVDLLKPEKATLEDFEDGKAEAQG